MSNALLIAILVLLVAILAIAICNAQQNRRKKEYLNLLLERSKSYVIHLERLGRAVAQATTAFLKQLDGLTGALTVANQKLSEAIARRQRIEDAYKAVAAAIDSVGAFITAHANVFAAFGLTQPSVDVGHAQDAPAALGSQTGKGHTAPV